MHKILDYEIETELYEGPNSLVYQAKKTSGNADERVILKLLKKEYPTAEEIARFNREFEMTDSFRDDRIVRVYHFFKYQNSYAMAIEDFGGQSIANYLLVHQLTLSQFLPLAISIAESLGIVHGKRIIHKDINPANIVWNPKTNQVKLIDFGISSELSHETTTLQNLNNLEGTLSYLSPEQTGRMNRTMDYRTDLYSLGATFYMMLTNQPPFTTKDEMELVHCHIAKDPRPLNEINKQIPKILSDIVLKLMAKMAESRYQNAMGLAEDLKECWTQLRRKGDIQSFPLGRNDISDRFEIPQKLYGREAEVKIILDAFGRIERNTKEVILIRGYSGIGKSSIVQEIYKPIVQRRGIFIRGKFDQFKRNSPYASIIEAFQEFTRQILTESKEKLAARKSEILLALGQNAQVIIEVIPEIKLIIGEQPNLRMLSPEESKNRFNLVFRNFVRVLVSDRHPLILFLDDLQWADLPSLNLLELIVTDLEIGNILVIAAYRDNEVNETHPLIATLNEIESKKISIHTITLSPLTLYHIYQVLADTLLVSKDESSALAALCFEKTQGNPFFLNQFLQMLYNEKFISFDKSDRKWVWEINEIRSRDITDNVVDLMSNKIRKLPEITQNVLRLAACIGSRFDLGTLATVNEKSLTTTSLELWDGIVEGLILPMTADYNLLSQRLSKKISETNIDNSLAAFESIIPEYRFLHDRVQQAAYSLIAEDQRKKVHLKVGRLLLKKSESEENIFDIVNHLNQGKEAIFDQLEKQKLIELNLLVSKKAKLSAAYAPAYNYAENAVTLLGENGWQTNFDLSVRTYIEAAETAYLSAQFESMERLTETILFHEIVLIDKAKIYEIKMNASIAMHNSLQAVKTALQVLKLLGVEISENPSQEEIGIELGETMKTLSKFQVNDLRLLPVMEDREKIAAMRILELTFSPCFQTNPGLFPLLVLRMTQLSLKHGNTSTSPLAYACYGLILCGIVGDIDSGYQFGQLAINLIDILHNEEHKPNTIFNVTVFVTHWKEPLRNTIKPFLESYHLGMIVGDFEFGSWSAMFYNVHSYFAGLQLPKIIEETTKFRHAIQELKQETATKYISMFLQVLLNLSSNSITPWVLIGDVYNEEEMLVIHQKANDNNALCYFYFHKFILCFLMEAEELTINNLKMIEKHIAGVPSTQFVVLFHFYDSLTQLRYYLQSPDSEKEAILTRVSANQTKMKTWATHCPENCLHKFYLVEAEKASVLGEDWQAMDFFDKAGKLAKQNEFLQEEALASELFARFWLSRDKEELAQMLLNKAYYLYWIWGAKVKTSQLEKKYGHLLSKRGKGNNTGTIHTGATISSLDEDTNKLDLVSVMKASQSISQEIVIEELLKNMMHIVIENAGAQTGFLLQEKNGNWVIEAQGSATQKEVTVLQSIPIQPTNTDNAQVPLSIIQYVSRTKESIVLEAASRDSKFISDPYIIQNQPKSVLCTAILHHGKVLGILYLENNAISGVFTTERLEVLQILSSQVAISLENATLYASLEEKVSQRTTQLEEAHKKILVLEKETTEKQLAGGFAHEMRNALVGPKLIIQHILGQDRSEPFESTSILKNRKLKEIYLLIKDTTPPNILQEALKAMKVIFDNEEQMDISLNMIQKAVSKGLSITQLIMDYSKVGNEQAGKNRLDLNLLLKNIITEYKKDWSQLNIQIELDLSQESIYILGLETHFESVYKNLLLNAKDAVLDKNIPDKKDPRIEIKTQLINSSFIAEFTDNGSGISQINLTKIYDAFFSTKPDSGTGLGLGVVKKIISLYNGNIEVKSELGKGTTFTVSLPIQMER